MTIARDATHRCTAARWLSAGLLSCGLACGNAVAFTPPAQVVVVTDDNYPPYLFRTADGELEGIVKDKWALWSSKTGIPVQLIGTAWSTAQQSVQNDKADVIESLAYTEARSRLYDYSPAYATVDARIFFHKTISGISDDIDSLRGFEIGAKEGSACANWLRERGVESIRNFSNSEDLIKAAGKGQVRLFCMDAPTAQYFLFKQNLDSEFRQSPPLYSAKMHWAVHKGHAELRDFVQAGFEKISPQEIKDIDARWLGSPLFAFNQRYLYYFAGFMLTFASLSALLLLWNRSLRARVATKTGELTAAFESLKKYADKYQDLYDHAPCGYHSVDGQGIFVEINDTELQWLGYTREEVIGKLSIADFVTDDYRPTVRENLARLKELGVLNDIECDLVRKDGSRISVLISVTALRDRDGNYLASRATVYDVTRRKRAEARAHYFATWDPLTDLPNRNLLHDRLEQTVAQARQEQGQVGVLLVDLDRFKTVNDTLGHAFGDRLLAEVAARLAHCIRAGDTVGRISSDEFVLILSNLPKPADAAVIAGKVLAETARLFELEGQRVYCTASVGIAIFPGDGDSAESLIRNADSAMHRAKQNGRNNYQFFLQEMNERAMRRLQLETALRGALQRKEFWMQYQPKLDLATRAVVGFEALLRWRHAEHGLVSPTVFIPILEDADLMVPVGQWVLRTVCEQIVRWQTEGNKPLPVAVNLSARQFQQKDLASVVSRVFSETGVDPTLIEFELTESSLMHDPKEAALALRRLKEFGVCLAVDDFGTGYSSLAYLKRFPLDALKIDRIFVCDVTTNAEDAAIVQTIINLAHGLKLKVIAEGVETEAQLAFLAAHGCDQAQGFLLSVPVEAKQAIAFFETAAQS